LILESGRLDDVVSASQTANETQYSSLYLAIGEKVKLRDLLWGILLRSANDACVAAAEHLAGSVPKFVDRMNRRARELGLTDTRFMNPHGLHEPGHYSSAADQARIALEAMKHPLFNEMVRAKKHIIDRSIRKENATLFSRSRILKRWPLADGVKTGYTRQAGMCFIGSATMNGWRLLSVVMKSPDIVADTRSLLEYGYHHYRSVCLAGPDRPLASLNVAGGISPTVGVGLAQPLYTVVRRGETPPSSPLYHGLPGSLAAPVKRGQVVGAASWPGDPLSSTDAKLIALGTVGEAPAAAVVRAAWWPLAAALFTHGALRYGASAKDHRRRRRRLAKRGGGVDRRRQGHR
jgi:D-alanyl-D-alanine carboxypeptidase (penicillin-binding protein 5/6)